MPNVLNLISGTNSALTHTHILTNVPICIPHAILKFRPIVYIITAIYTLSPANRYLCNAVIHNTLYNMFMNATRKYRCSS